MRKTDISKYTDKIDVRKNPSAVGAFFGGIGRIILTALLILICAGLIVGVSLGIYVFKIANEPTGIDINARALNLSSFIYIKNPDTDKFEEYQTLYGTENRIWVDLSEMPKAMPDAIVAIEDKRFYEHHGVDWFRTGSAVMALVSGSDNYGGSTLTQQLIKNITDDNEVSLTRKLREIFRALNVEKEYSKDDIIEAYLNVVNFGNNAQGVEAASELYFDKPIGECSIAQCAAIAGITQNPSRWNPLVYPENNKIRREIVLSEMYDQGYITKAEYDEAMAESETMTFVDYSAEEYEEEEDDSVDVQNWYMDQMFYDVARDLAKYYDISEGAASEKLYTEGLKIYSAMDLKMQEMIEREALNSKEGYDYDLEIGMEMIDFDGRVICTAGSSHEKEGNLEWDRASHSVLQPGSSIKGIIPYPMALQMKLYNYSSLVTDQPLEHYFMDGSPGPYNSYGYYTQYLTVPEALSWSSNACAVQTMDMVGTYDAYNQATSNLGFSHLGEADADNVGALSLGGMQGGVTVREMAAAIAYIGNGGLYYEPYTYYYVTDQNDKIILDNRNDQPIEAYSPEVAYEMNRLLKYNVETSTHSASSYAQVYGWEIAGKTGTTDDGKDIWFVGASPYCTLACWMGYDTPDVITYTDLAAITWQKVMANFLENRANKEFDMPDTIIPATFCLGSGMLANSGCSNTALGYYTVDDMPGYCTGVHVTGSHAASSSPSSSSSDASDSSDPDADSPSSGGDDDTPSITDDDSSGEDTPSDGADETQADDGGESSVPESGADDGEPQIAPE